MSNRLNQPDLSYSPKTGACVTVTFWLVAFLGSLQSSVLQPSCPIAFSARESSAIRRLGRRIAGFAGLPVRQPAACADSCPYVLVVVAAALRRRCRSVTSRWDSQIRPQQSPRKTSYENKRTVHVDLQVRRSTREWGRI